MATMKKKIKGALGYAWQMIKSSLPSLLMYFCAGSILFLVIFKKKTITWSGSNITWSVVCVLGAAAYNALLAWAHGGTHYEMLVSGNIKRSAADAYGNAYKMSSHKIAKEYRVWKGFVMGAIMGLFPLIFGILFGCTVPAGKVKTEELGGVSSLIAFLLSGWSLVPVYCMNQSGIAVNYFYTCLFAIIPIVVTGVFYILGAYSRRNKAIREQMLADKAAQAEANKPKKINYGGLPGTKPKKKK